MEIMRAGASGRLTRAAAAAVVAAAFAMASFASLAEEIESKIARGGRLYDKWYEFTDGDLPSGTHVSYPESSKKRKKATWRCKECHGWDYMGKDGAYGEGNRYTGITGIRGAAGADPDTIVAILKSESHGYTEDLFAPEDFRDLALFVSKGQLDMDKYIDRATKEVKGGDVAKGAAYYNTVCAGCHGLDGKKPKDMSKSIGEVARDNPWRALHNIRNGQPGENMPALRALPLEVTVDILAYTATLPE